MSAATTRQRIARARARLQAVQDARYQMTRRTTQATVTSVNRDTSTGHIDGTVWATIDGVSDQLIFVGMGTGVTVGDTLRVENRGSALAPDWTLIGKANAVQGTEGLVDTGRPLSTPTGLGLATAVYTPTPGNLRARLTASWTQIGTWEGVAHYRVQLRRDADSSITSATVYHDSSATTNNYSWSELEPGIAYSARVQAVGYGGSVSSWTSWSSTTTAADTTAPATPSGLSAEQVDERTLRLRWTANTEADLWYYKVDVGLDGSSSLGGAYPLITGTTAWAMIPTQPEVDYYFRVQAVDTSGNASAWSSWSGPYSTAENPSLAGLIYLQPKAELITDLTAVSGTMDVNLDVYDSGEFAHILTADGATEEIVKITSGATVITGGYRFSITRAADGGSASAFDAGTPVYTLGQRGYIYADSRDDVGHTDTPYIDVYGWDDPYTGTWANRDHKVRLGNLDGITDPNFGALSGFGLWSENVYLSGKITITNQSDIEISNLYGNLDDVSEGSTYGKVQQTILGGGYIQVGSGTKDSSLSGWKIDSTEIVGQSSGSDQVVLNTSGQVVAGGGAVTMDSSGITVDGNTSRFGSGAGIQVTASGTEYLKMGNWYNGASLLGSGIYAGNSALLLKSSSSVGVDADGGLNVYYQSSPSGATSARDVNCRHIILAATGGTGTLSSDGGTTAWSFAGYTTTAPSATGYVSVTINGTTYKLLAST